jgi:Suppressor of fused protein (SUFU)
MVSADTYEILEKHVRAFFEGHTVDCRVWGLGPMREAIPDFRVACVSPGPRLNLWTYLSLGSWEIGTDQPGCLEFFVIADHDSPRMVEMATMVAHYHRSHTLGLGHTFPIGEPWLPKSSLDHGLVSLPYQFGLDLEVCDLGERHVHFLWVLPITERERDYKAEHGLEAIEQRFEAAALEYWNPMRDSVV